jgi:hypothetical protein
VLHCEDYGCTSETAQGWVAFLSRNPDDADDQPITVTYCPPCAYREFGVQATLAATYT